MSEHRPPRIYVIGPFRSPTEYERRQHIARAEATALEVARAGAYYRCPHLHSCHFDGLLTDAYWLGLGLDLLAECDAAVLVPGWQEYLRAGSPRASHGSIAEVAECERRGMLVLVDVEAVSAFVAAWSPEHEVEMRALVTGRTASGGPCLTAPLPGDLDPDPALCCEAFVKGAPAGHCEGSGHFLCRQCSRRAPAEPEDLRV